MGKILVVEPRNMLRQAISLALFPDHEVQMAALLSESNAAVAKEFDLVIIDSAALRATNSLSSQLVRTVQSWKVPTIWIDDTGARQAPASDKRVVLSGPIQKESLQSAVTKCLAVSSSKQNGPTSVPAKKPMAIKEASTVAASQSSGPEIIELVDVVAEPPQSRKTKTQETKTQQTKTK
jgi:hypothetical protein